MGRTTKLNPERQAIIVEAVREGNAIEVAAQAAGISHQTFYNWLERGEKAESGIYFEFFEAIKKAESEAEQYHVANIKKASKKQWQAAAWWLERKFPDRWGRRDRQQVDLSGSLGIQIIDDIPRDQ